MINIGKILKRSWYILWNYRILWIFGILLALTTGGGSSGNSGGNSGSSRGDGNNFPGTLPENAPQWMHDLSQWFTQNVVPMFTHPEQYISTFVTIGIVLFLIVVVCSILAALVRYPSETAVIRMVDEFENSGSKVGFRQGWKLGWTRRAFRLWLIDLILSIPVLLFILLLISAGLIVFASLSSTFQIVNGVGVVAATGLIFLSLFLMIVVGVFLTLLRNFIARAATLEDLGVRASLKYGWAMFKRNWKSAGLMWLVMIGIGIGFGVLGIILFFLLIPAYLVLLIPAGLVAGLPAMIAYGIASIFASGPLAWIIAAVVAIPFFFTILFFPLVVVNGWYELYVSNVWTLTYREIKAMENLAAPVLPVEVAPEGEK